MRGVESRSPKVSTNDCNLLTLRCASISNILEAVDLLPCSSLSSRRSTVARPRSNKYHEVIRRSIRLMWRALDPRTANRFAGGEEITNRRHKVSTPGLYRSPNLSSVGCRRHFCSHIFRLPSLSLGTINQAGMVRTILLRNNSSNHRSDHRSNHPSDHLSDQCSYHRSDHPSDHRRYHRSSSLGTRIRGLRLGRRVRGLG